MEVANTILQQIKALDFWALGAWGAKDYIGGKVDGKHEGVKFRVNGSKTKRGSWLMITLNAWDTYDIKVYRIVKADVKYDHEIEGIYAEDLVRIIDGIVG
jgi:hypothetical protein